MSDLRCVSPTGELGGFPEKKRTYSSSSGVPPLGYCAGVFSTLVAVSHTCVVCLFMD